MKDEPTQEEIDAAVKTLNEALDGLKVLRGNPEALNSALEAASKKDESKYTAESWAALMAVVEEVKAIDLENATQKEIDKAVAKLTKPEDKKDDTVKTGDSTMILGMVALMAVSAIAYISLKRKKLN